MKNQNKNYRSIITALFSIAFVMVLGLSTVREASAQRYLTEIKTTTEIKGISQFATDVSDFLKLAEFIEQENNVSPAQLKRLEAAGKKVKDGAGNLRTNLKALIANLKKSERWNDELDKQINEILGNRKAKGFFQRNGGRNLLNAGETAINSVAADVDAIINDARKLQSVNLEIGGVLLKTSFMPAASAKKGRLKCALLGLAIFGAEVAGAKITAENLDGHFDKGCGAGANATT